MVRRRGSFWHGVTVAVFVCATAGHGMEDAFPDDGGDSPAYAEEIMAGSGSIRRIIEIDTDEDWYHFRALPDISYRVDVTCSSLWDAVVTLRAPDGLLRMMATNSAMQASPAKAILIWTNRGAAGPYYIGVGGYLRFTTGAYTLAVSALNWIDTDADGLPDEWEQQWLGGLGGRGDEDADKDGMNNLNEYLAGTDPSNAMSRLAITAIRTIGGAAHISWPSSPYALYRVEARPDPFASYWKNIGEQANMLPTGGILHWSDALMGSGRCYRVVLITGE